MSAFLVGTSSWKEQFKDALRVNAGKDFLFQYFSSVKLVLIKKFYEDEGENIIHKEETEIFNKPRKKTSIVDYFMHFISLFWKLLFAFVPPTGEFKNK